MEIDQDNLRTGTARLSCVSWTLLKLLVLHICKATTKIENEGKLVENTVSREPTVGTPNCILQEWQTVP